MLYNSIMINVFLNSSCKFSSTKNKKNPPPPAPNNFPDLAPHLSEIKYKYLIWHFNVNYLIF